jgi:hypothetical protein
MDTATVAQIITAATALVAVTVGPWQTARMARRQIRASVVSTNRQAWINVLRENLAELVTHLQTSGSPIDSERFDEAEHKESFRQILLREAKVRMLLNPEEADHKQLVTAISAARALAGEPPPPEYDQEVHDILKDRSN